MGVSTPRVVLTSMLVFSACAVTPKVTPWYDVHGSVDEASRRHVAQGDVVGFADSSETYAWLGIPYAAPPVGALRWKAPRPPLPWEGLRAATEYGEICTQLKSRIGRSSGGDVVGREDCLTLNVSAPRSNVAEKRPVMVWIHGGGNTVGTANVYGVVRNLAAKYGVVVVSVNYRLGVLGWFRHASLRGPELSAEDASGNFGTLDLIAALRWVNENIAAFGGDSGNVTVFGESAGGFNTFSLVASPLAKGLFHRAIVQSGMPRARTVAEAEHFTDDVEPGMDSSSSELLLKWLIADGRAGSRDAAKTVLATMAPAEVATYLRARSPEALLHPFITKGGAFGMYAAPDLFRDGAVLPTTSVLETFADASLGPTVPVLLGTNRDEFKLFMAFNPRYVRLWFGVLPHIRDDEVYTRDAAIISNAWKAFGTDAPAMALTSAGRAPVYAYRFDWDQLPSRFGVDLRTVVGAGHGLEIGFVFNDLKGEYDPFGIVVDENRAGRELVTNAMSSYWVQFARNGSPGRGVEGTLPEWTPYDISSAEAKKLMVLDAPEGGGIRLDSNVQSAETVEAMLWRGATADDLASRCRLAAWLFYGFTKSSGGWTKEREASYRAHCPDLPVEQAFRQASAP